MARVPGRAMCEESAEGRDRLYLICLRPPQHSQMLGRREHLHVVVVKNRALYVSSGSDGDGCDPYRYALRADDAVVVGSLTDAICWVDFGVVLPEVSGLMVLRHLLSTRMIFSGWGSAGGEGGIRTHVRVSPKHAFQACAFSHSATSPASTADCCWGSLSRRSS